MPQVTHIRNPYPVPDLSREGEWIPGGPVLGNNVSPNDLHWYSKLTPHERLFAHHTLNSVRRDRRLYRAKVPNDALDLALTSVYVHSKDTLVPKKYVPMQPEVLGKETWRQLRNEIKISDESALPIPKMQSTATTYQETSTTVAEAEPLKEESQFYRNVVLEGRIHPCSVKLNITGPHGERTSHGYSRKADGTFYGI